MGFEPIFHVADVARSAAWFDRGGFEVSFHDDTYAFARRDRDLTIHLAQASPADLLVMGVCTSTAKTPTGWPKSGGRQRSKSTDPATRTTASGRAPSAIPTAT